MKINNIEVRDVTGDDEPSYCEANQCDGKLTESIVDITPWDFNERTVRSVCEKHKSLIGTKRV